MGWFYKRSAKFGPFRLNFSKSGIGVSAGIRGARVSTGPRGTYVNLGTNGFYYRQKVGGRYSAASSARGVAPASINPVHQHVPSLPGNFNYPTFPKHGLPRIVTTLGLLSIPIAIAIWILVAIGTSSTGSTEFRSNDNSRSGAGTTGNKLTHSSRERGFQAGFDYGLRDKNAIKGKNPKQRGVKKLAAQIAGKQREDQEWQLGWIDGYNKALAPAAAHNANANRSVRDQTTLRETAPKAFQQLPRTASNGYIRGPRGGCYYLSGSGRKVYVDRGLCN